MLGKMFLALGLLLLLPAALAEVLDENSVSIGDDSAKVSGGDFAAWVSVGEDVTGTASGGGYIATMGYYYDNAPPDTNVGPFDTSWQLVDQNIQFQCHDDDSGCKWFTYSLDGITYYLNWGGPDSNTGVLIAVDGNHQLNYYSTDVMDNNEDSSLLYAARATLPPGGTSPGRGGRTFEEEQAVTEEEEVFSETEYFTPLDEPGIPVLDQTEQDILKEKRLAGPDEVRLSRSMKVIALMQGGEIIGYRVKVTVSVENVSGRQLSGVEVIEGLTEEIVESASEIESDDSFEILEERPAVLRFMLGSLEAGQTKSFEYRFSRTAEQGPITEEMFKEMPAPIALVALVPGDLCLGVRCNDFNPCTRDYCVGGTCIYAPANEGKACGTGMKCADGTCVSTREPTGGAIVPGVKLTRPEQIVLVLLAGAVALGFAAQLTMKRFWKKRGGKGK